jgi:hypothetical protein
LPDRDDDGAVERKCISQNMRAALPRAVRHPGEHLLQLGNGDLDTVNAAAVEGSDGKHVWEVDWPGMFMPTRSVLEMFPAWNAMYFVSWRF